MSTPTTRELPRLRRRWLTVLLAAAVLFVAATVGSTVTAPSASAQIWGWPYNYGYGYGYGYGWPYYGGGYGYPGSGFFLGNNTFYLNGSYSGCTNAVYCGSAYSYGTPYSSYYGYGSYPYSSYGSYPYSSYSPLYSGYNYLGNSLYSYQPTYQTAYAPSTTVTVSAQPYAAGYVSGGGNYCNLANGGMVWVPAGTSPSALGC